MWHPRPQVSAEDNPAASAVKDEVPQVATPLSHQEAVLKENVLENLATATTTNEANVEPSPTEEEDSKATDPVTSIPESAVGPQFDYHVEHRP